jgi:hypothetical protein
MVTEINYKLLSTTREGIRKELIEKFLEEKAGTGKGDECSKYHYIVEKIGSYSIILKRPAALNKGLDFTVNVDGMYFMKNKKYSSPSHNNIFDALTQIIDNEKYSIIKHALFQIYNCEPFNEEMISDITFIDFQGITRPISIILFAVKWLFIEQDVTY